MSSSSRREAHQVKLDKFGTVVQYMLLLSNQCQTGPSRALRERRDDEQHEMPADHWTIPERLWLSTDRVVPVAKRYQSPNGTLPAPGGKAGRQRTTAPLEDG